MRPNLRLHIRIALLTVLALFSDRQFVRKHHKPRKASRSTLTPRRMPSRIFGKRCCSGRAILSLRDSYRRDLRETKRSPGRVRALPRHLS